jgi:GAF domain-containing protein/ActR/RegA family two-component response regulator
MDNLPIGDPKDRLAALLKATKVVASSLDLEQSLRTVVEQATIISGTDVVRLFLLDEEQKILHCRVGMGLPADEERDLAIPVGVSFSGQVAATGKPLAVADCREDPRLRFSEHVTKYNLISYLGLPVKAGDRVLGVLVFNTQTPRAYSDEEIAYLFAFADQAAIAIENARLFEASQRHRRHLEALPDAMRAIMSGLDLRSTLDQIATAVLEVFGVIRANVYRYEPTVGTLTCVAVGGGGDPEKWLGKTLLPGSGLASRVIREGRPVWVPDVLAAPELALPDWALARIREEGFRASIGVPLIALGEIRGALVLGDVIGRTFSQEEIELLTAFADQAAIAIENARLYEATRRAEQEARSLYEVAHSLTTSLEPREVLHLISMKTTELLGTPHAQVVLWDEGTKTLRFGAAHGIDAERVKRQVFRLGEGVNGIVAETRKPLIVNDYQRFPGRRSDMSELVAVIGVPLLYRGRLLGVLSAHTKQPGATFTQDNLTLLTSFADQAALAIENARLCGTIRQHADELDMKVHQRTAELEEALRVRTEFLGKMSHELRTPLNFILGFSDLLQQGVAGPLTSKQATYVDRIQTGGKRLLSLVTDVLDIAQVDVGKSRLQLEPVILSSLVQEVLGLVQVQASGKGLHISTSLDPWLPFVVADRFKLGQILFRLFGNAVKFTPDGGSIHIETARIEGQLGDLAVGQPGVTPSCPVAGLPGRPAEFLELRVQDTGIGIRPEDLETIFAAFHQVDGSDTRAYEGAGLGLTLVRRFVEQHGGRVWAQSPGLGQGARFVVRLPRLEIPRAKKVLFVEDDEMIRANLTSVLESAGFKVVQAARGSQALTTLAEGPPDLLVLDLALPDMDGSEILRRVRGVEEISRFPVLVIMEPKGASAEEAMEYGADEFLATPVSPHVFVDTVLRLLSHSAVGRRVEATGEAGDRGTHGVVPEEGQQ